MKLFSTITSPVFSELVLAVWCDEIGHLPSDVVLWKTLGEMYEIRPFKLGFSLGVPYAYEGDAQQVFMGGLDSAAEKGFLKFLDSPPDIRIVQSSKCKLGKFSPSPD